MSERYTDGHEVERLAREDYKQCPWPTAEDAGECNPHRPEFPKKDEWEEAREFTDPSLDIGGRLE